MSTESGCRRPRSLGSTAAGILALFFVVAATACGDEAGRSQPAPPTATLVATSTPTIAPSPTATATALSAPTPPAATATPRAVDPDLDRQLIEASRDGDPTRVRQLIAAGASVHAREATRTPLIEAAYAGHLDVAELLVAAGADVNAKDNTVQSPYLIATSEIGDSPRAVSFLRLMLRSGADLRSLDSYNGTGLIRAADRGFVEIVRELLSTDIDKDHINNLGWTALLEAVILGGGDARHLEVVRLLVAAGANVNLADRSGITPLQLARSRGYSEMVSVLAAAGGR